jgi:hypothetical protein
MLYLLYLCIVTCFVSGKALRLTHIFNPEILSEDYPATNDDALSFSLWMNSDLSAKLQNTGYFNLCFQINGKDCHCFQHIGDIRAYAFKVPPQCKVFRTPKVVVWFSIKLQLDANTQIISSPLSLWPEESRDGLITMILPLTIADLPRASLLFATLSALRTNSVYELIIITPDIQSAYIDESVGSIIRDALPFRVVEESSLFSNSELFLKSDAFPYSIQMSLKLLVARLVQTPFYITLDADVLLLKPRQILEVMEKTAVEVDVSGNNADNLQYFKGIFEDESRNVHLSWWKGSASFLDLEYVAYSDNRVRILSTDLGAGFSVTPAVLSSFGSLVVIQEIILAQKRCYGFHLTDGDAEIAWVSSFGKPTPLCKATPDKTTVWSEYTIYRLVLDAFYLFSEIHEPQNKVLLHCHDVWFEDQLPWNAAAAYASTCLFSVVQSSTGVSPSDIISLLQTV